jgi:uncharacterized protein YnzC (UPF0291/DUF896 family)
MEKADRVTLEEKENQLQAKYKDYFLAKWNEAIKKGLKVRLVVDFNNGSVTNIQDQVIISGSSVLDFYSKKMLDNSTIE